MTLQIDPDLAKDRGWSKDKAERKVHPFYLGQMVEVVGANDVSYAGSRSVAVISPIPGSKIKFINPDFLIWPKVSQ